MTTKFVIYHSPEWGTLVEQGWITHEVIDHPLIDGLRIAKMIYHPQRRYA